MSVVAVRRAISQTVDLTGRSGTGGMARRAACVVRMAGRAKPGERGRARAVDGEGQERV